MTHQLLRADFNDCACGVVFGGGVIVTLAGRVDCPACVAAMQTPLLIAKPTHPHPLKGMK